MRKAIFLISISIITLIISIRCFSITEDLSSNVSDIIEDSIIKEEVQESVNIEKTGTLDNITFIVDVVRTEKLDNNTYIIIGNTATEKSYSGEIRIESRNIDDIELEKTYTFIVEPLMSMSTPPVVTEVIHYKSTDNDIKDLHKNREKISNYNSKIFEYKDMQLHEIIEDSNISYCTWTNDEINQFMVYIERLGYSEDFEIKSNVRIISIPN